jgi:hypothetical protein
MIVKADTRGGKATDEEGKEKRLKMLIKGNLGMSNESDTDESFSMFYHFRH